MPRLFAIVEGEGEVAAAPTLLYGALQKCEAHDWFVDERRITKVGSLPAFRKRLDDYANLIRLQATDAAIVLLDLDVGCPLKEATLLAEDLRAHALPVPVAVVLAHREYEAWFLASLPSLVAQCAELPDDSAYEGEPESPKGCKGQLTDMMPSGKTYKPTLHQKPFTRAIDFDMAAERSRSFRRLLNAVRQLTSAEEPMVTP